MLNSKKTLFCVGLLLVIFQLTAQQRKGTIIADNAIVRDCDDVNCKPLFRLRNGDVCSVVGVKGFNRVNGYDFNAWIQIEKNGRIGFIYGPLISLESVDPNHEISVDSIGFVEESSVNVRFCPSLSCQVIFELPVGVPFQLLAKTKKNEVIDNLGNHPWYFIEFEEKRGYVFGSLIKAGDQNLRIDSAYAQVYDFPGHNNIGTVYKNETYRVLERNPKSELIRPFGRQYWYKILMKNNQPGWICGSFTSKSEEPVDCQCVDFIKHSLNITGATKNAFEWDQIFNGGIPININGVVKQIFYEEIKDKDKVSPGDIAIFDRLHKDAHDQYGHIGFVREMKKKEPGRWEVLIEGANHKGDDLTFYPSKRCNNISKKWYRIDQHVLFFHPQSTTN